LLLLCIACTLSPSRVHAQKVDSTTTSSSLYVDQDTFMSPPTDQDYTMGFMFGHTGPWVVRHHLDVLVQAVDLLTFANRLHTKALQAPNPQKKNFAVDAFMLGVSAFTPLKGVNGSILSETQAISNDRPYACLAYATARRTSATARYAITTDLAIGWLGSNICRNFQSYWHAHWGHDVHPGGWAHQISNGGEPTAKYRLASTFLLGARELASLRAVDYSMPPSVMYDVVADAEGNAGYYTNVATGLRLRLGHIRSAFWSADRRPISPISIQTACAKDQVTPNDTLSCDAAAIRQMRKATPSFWQRTEIYGWVSGGATGWFYNALLQGQFRPSDVTLSYYGKPTPPGVAALNPLVADWQWGGTLTYSKLSLSYQYNSETALFNGPNRRHHAWGGLYLSWGFGKQGLT